MGSCACSTRGFFPLNSDRESVDVVGHVIISLGEKQEGEGSGVGDQGLVLLPMPPLLLVMIYTQPEKEGISCKIRQWAPLMPCNATGWIKVNCKCPQPASTQDRDFLR